MSTIDAAEYRAANLKLWEQAAAVWKKWWPLIHAGTRPVSERMVDLAGIRDGDRVLDVATGGGEPALTAATRHPGARVTGTDQSPQMLAFAGERAAAAAAANVEWRVMDAEDIALDPESYDVIFSRWGLMFLLDLPGALERMHRALVPGGRLVAATWDVDAKNPLMSMPMRVAREALGLPPPPPDVPGPFRLADATLVEEMLRAAGFGAVTHERMHIAAEASSLDEYLAYVRDMGTALAAALESIPAEQQERIWARIAEEARRFETASGSLRFPGEPILFVARRD